MKEKTEANRKCILYIILTVSVILVAMIVYEILKQVLFPEITIWESHTVTILFSATGASVAAFFISRRENLLNIKLKKENQKHQETQQKLENILDQLHRSKSEIKTLTGLLPICCSCKKIRDDSGYWNQIESYISQHADVDFTHSICPECLKKYYPDVG